MRRNRVWVKIDKRRSIMRGGKDLEIGGRRRDSKRKNRGIKVQNAKVEDGADILKIKVIKNMANTEKRSSKVGRRAVIKAKQPFDMVSQIALGIRWKVVGEDRVKGRNEVFGNINTLFN